MKAVNPNSASEYIAKEDRNLPKKEQTIFRIKNLTLNEEAFLTDNLGDVKRGGDFSVTLGTQALCALHIGLLGVDNLLDDKGKEVKLKRDEAGHPVYGKCKPWRNSDLSRIPREARGEVAGFILNGGELDEEEIKN